MRLLRRRRHAVIGVVVPVFDVEQFLPACLDNLLGQSWPDLDVVVVDDGSTDASGDIAERYAAQDARVRVLRTANHGLGAARNAGMEVVRGDYLAFLDSDDVPAPDAYRTLVSSLLESGSDFSVGSMVRWEGSRRVEPRWMARLHRERRLGLTVADHPEMLGDVFAWNKLFRRDWWDATGLHWPEGVRYEDQPLTTAAFLRGRFDVLPEVVYHWRIRSDGSSITQKRGTVEDVADRLHTKLLALELARTEGTPEVVEMLVERVLAGDLTEYFAAIPDCSDDWWRAMRHLLAEIWGDRSVATLDMPPAQRLVGWLVQQDRRDDATLVTRHLAERRGPLARVEDVDGIRVDVPGLDPDGVAREALLLRAGES